MERSQTIAEQVSKAASGIFHAVVIARNSEEGKQAIREHRPHLIIANSNIHPEGGMEFVRQVRKMNEVVRMVLYGEPGDILPLVPEAGISINGLQLLPFDMEQLKMLLTRQEQKISKWRINIVTTDEKTHLKEQFDRSREILGVISETTSLFFRTRDYERNINRLLGMIGMVTRASRVYVYRNYMKDGEEYTSRIAEWTAEGIMPVIGNLSVSNRHLASSGFESWIRVMSKEKGYISGLLKNFELAEQRELAEHGIKSILAIPIFVEDYWWGMIGIDDCRYERTWTDTEISALEIVANTLGLAIHKTEIDEELSSLNRELEIKIKTRTRDLELEVAERAMTEALLKDSEEKYRLIYENATYGIMLIKKGRIVMLNPALVDILEDMPRNLIGKKLSKIARKEHREIIKQQFGKDSHADLQNIFQLKIMTGKKNIKWLELKPTRIDWYGEPAYLVFAANITPQKEAQDELYRLNRDLEKTVEEEVRKIEQQQQLLMQKSKLESIGELSAGLAHEINQPLVSISMGLDNMLMTIDKPECDKSYIKEKINLLFDDIDRIKNIIEHVRIFSRDQQNSKLGKVDMKKVVNDTLSMVNRMMNEENIILEKDFCPGDIFTYGNHYRLEQVMLNLISNARFAVNQKERNENGQPYVKKIKINCHVNGDEVHVDVWDNGIGIPPEILTNIFNPFFTTKAETKGTGLGLSISYGIVREMKGEIVAESIEHEFTNMKLQLPFYKEATA